MTPQDWHTLEAGDALLRLDSTADGLTPAAATERLQQYGPNAIPGKKRRSLPVMLLAQFSDFMIVVLLAAALISGFSILTWARCLEWRDVPPLQEAASRAILLGENGSSVSGAVPSTIQRDR